MKLCFDQEKKREFLKSINQEYNYNESFLERLSNEDVAICTSDTIDQYIIYSSDSVIRDVEFLCKASRNFLNSKKIDYWLHAGSLLGAFKYDAVIPWDDDGDFAVPSDSFIKLIIEIKNLPVKVNNSGEKYYVSYENEIMYSRVVVYKLHSNRKFKERPFLDLLLLIQYQGKYLANYDDDLKKGYFIEYEDVYPLKKKQFSGLMFNVPGNSEHILDISYPFWKHLDVANRQHLKGVKEIDKNLFFINEDYIEEYVKMFDYIVPILYTKNDTHF
jgi:hypothetical protein